MLTVRGFKVWVTMMLWTMLSCAGEGERFAEEEIIVSRTVTWLDVEPIFTAECSGCHDDPPKLGAPQSLKTYEEVLPWLNRIKVRSIEIGDMPPGGLRAENGALLIKEWIEQGAPQGEDRLDDYLESPTWDSSILQLFEIYCNTCHADPPTGGAPFPLKTYQQAVPYLERFRDRVVERRDMPPGGISDELHLHQIRLWLDGGGPQ